MNNSTSTTQTNQTSETTVQTGNTIVRPEGTYYYTSTVVYHAGTGTYIPAGHYYNPLTGAYFQTQTGSTVTDTTTPGVPNTGFGGDAGTLWFTLLFSLMIIAVASVYIARNAVSYR